MCFSDTSTHEIKWEGTFNAVSSNIKVVLAYSILTHAYIVIQLLTPFLFILFLADHDRFFRARGPTYSVNLNFYPYIILLTFPVAI